MTSVGRRRMIMGISKPAEMAALCEWPESIQSIRANADVNYRINDIGAAIASPKETRR